MTTVENPTGHQESGIRSLLSPHFIALAVLLLATVAMFADVLFTARPVVLSASKADLWLQFIHWRAFGFGELRQGNLALWNPHLFSGAPFLGGFQSALLYPPNALYLVLPLTPAINWGIAFHVFLAGAFTYAWAAGRGLHPLACFLGALMFMFGGTYFLHIFAGHLPNLCAMVWAPLLFLSIDAWFAMRTAGWCLTGILAVAMQVLAGHPQYVFYTAVAAGIYSLMCLGRTGKRLQVVLGLAAICVGGAALSAVQLLTSLAESGETLRSAGLSYDVAGMFSFPPENFLTLLAPGFFGNMRDAPYWGRCYLWEMSLFAGVTGLTLAGYGAMRGDRHVRRFSVTMVIILLILALGVHTPLFKILYYWVPGFDKFRGSSKFMFLASLFLAMLAAIGMDQLLKRGAVPRGLKWAPVIAAVLVGVAALGVRESASNVVSDSWWAKAMRAADESRESYLPPQAYSDASYILEAGRRASRSLLIAGGTLVVLAGVLFLAGRFRRCTGGIALLATVELFIFARSSLATFDLNKAILPELRRFLAEHPGDYRILMMQGENTAMSLGALDMWGYDAVVPRRYAQFMAFTQGLKPEEATQYLTFARLDRLYAMLRWRFAFDYDKQGNLKGTQPTDPPMERLHLIRTYRVLTNCDEIFAAMAAPSFDPRKEVILETAPSPQPATAGGKDDVELVASSTDSLTIEANLPSPAILLITDNYSKGWRARPLGETAQATYEVLPANYCLRAVPLAAGHHKLQLEYLPTGFVIGKWISLATVVAYLILLGTGIRKRKASK